METIKIPNFSSLNLLEPTTLDADIAIGGKSVVVVNSMNFSHNDKFMVGDKGSDTAELLTVDTVNNQTITSVEAAEMTHRRFEPVVKIFGDQIRLYVASNTDNTPPLDSNFSLLSSTTLNVDELYTEVVDQTGGSGFWYKFTYYNPTTQEETALSASIPIRGGDYGHYVSTDDIRQESGFADAPLIDDADIATARDRAESQVKGVCASSGYTMPLQSRSGVPYVPAIILDCTLLLAAGMVMSQQYQSTAPDAAKLGDAKRKEAERTLKQIAKNELILLDETEQPLLMADRVAGYPDETAADAGEGAKFTMAQRF